MMRTAAALLLLPALAGCWHTTSYVDRISWANDDSELGIIKLTFEERKSTDPLNGTTDKRNFKHQVFVRAVAGGELRAVGPERDGQEGGEFYYMKTAKYFLLNRIGVGGMGVTWSVLRLDGTYQDLASTPIPAGANDCTLLDVIPSPDGTRLARVERGAACTNPSLRVSFLGADTLQPLAPATALAAASWVDWTWTKAGDFLVIKNGSGSQQAFRLAPGATPVSVPVPTCTTPKTRSGPVSSDGRMASTDPTEIVIGSPDPQTAFGCGQP